MSTTVAQQLLLQDEFWVEAMDTAVELARLYYEMPEDTKKEVHAAITDHVCGAFGFRSCFVELAVALTLTEPDWGQTIFQDYTEELIGRWIDWCVEHKRPPDFEQISQGIETK